MKLKKQYDCNLVMMNDLIGGKWKLLIKNFMAYYEWR